MALILAAAFAAALSPSAQERVAPGTRASESPRPFGELCAGCHGAGGMGGDRGPALVARRGLRSRTEEQIREVISAGTPGGMPPFALPAADLGALTRWIRSLNAPAHDLAPDGDPRFVHTAEGPDDMSAHVRSVLTTSDLTIPIRDGELALGTWQGVYLWEHRRSGHRRRVLVTIQT